ELAEKLDASLNKERIERHVQLVLDRMNLGMRTVFQLFANEGFTLNEIANIRDATISEVEKDLQKARKILRNSIEKRFLIDSN
ncbi:RNA polymerase sigma factor, partial [Maribacter arcticus]